MDVAEVLLPADVAALSQAAANAVAESRGTSAEMTGAASQFSQDLAAAVVSVVLTSQSNVLPTELPTFPWTGNATVVQQPVELPAVPEAAETEALRPTSASPELSIFSQILAEARRIATAQTTNAVAPPHSPAVLPAPELPAEPSPQFLEAIGRPGWSEAVPEPEPLPASSENRIDPYQQVPLLLAEISRLLSFSSPQKVESTAPHTDTTEQPVNAVVVPIVPGSKPVETSAPSSQIIPGLLQTNDTSTPAVVPVNPATDFVTQDPGSELEQPVLSKLTSTRRQKSATVAARKEVTDEAGTQTRSTSGSTSPLISALAVPVAEPVAAASSGVPATEFEAPSRPRTDVVESVRSQSAAQPVDDAKERTAAQVGSERIEIPTMSHESGRLAGNSRVERVEGTLPPRDGNEFADRLSRFVLQSADRGEDLRVRVTPPDLGTIVIQVKSNADGLNIRLEASTEASQQLLTDNLPQLHESLAQLGRPAERVDVVRADSSAQYGSSGMPWSQQGSHESQQAPERRFLRVPERPRDENPVAQPVALAAGIGRLNELNIQI